MELTLRPDLFYADQHVFIKVRNNDKEVGAYEWQIFDNQGEIVAFGPCTFEFWRAVAPDPQEIVIDGGILPIGQYTVGIYREPHLDGTKIDVDQLIVDDHFTVEQQPVVSVALTKPGPAERDETDDPCATYDGFVAYLAAANPLVTPMYGAFGPAQYDGIKKLAEAYAATCHCSSLDELIPPGYEDARRAEAGLPPVSLIDASYLPCVELIRDYWHEEGMLVQTLNHILARFQNRRIGGADPLSRFDITPLLPLRNILWGWAEDEQHRMTLRRRAAEYQYEYGMRLIGRAIPPTRALVERRSGFLEAFHTILHQSHVFYKEYDDLTVHADAFPLYQSLRECHLVLSQGSHNQYGEMAVAARAEMLVMQYILAQQPMQEFLGGRPMTPYQEPWMGRVDTMKGIQGWIDTSVMHFHDLATTGEKLVLTVRLGNWVQAGAKEAETWAIAFRALIQRYVAAYRAVTGVDLSQGVDTTMPAELIARRLNSQRRRA